MKRPPSALNAGDDSSSEDDVSLGAIAHPTWDTTRVRLTEHTSSTERLDPRMIACLGVVREEKQNSASENSLVNSGSRTPTVR